MEEVSMMFSVDFERNHTLDSLRMEKSMQENFSMWKSVMKMQKQLLLLDKYCMHE